MRCTGEEETAFAQMAAGRGVIFALPHMGNWEHAGAWIIARGVGSLTTVAERLRPESLFERFVAFRESLGMEVLALTGSRTNVFAALAQRLRAGKLVCLPCDRDLTASGVEVTFFGERARMAAGPAALAVQTGAALMPVTLWFEGEYWRAHIYGEIPVPESGSRKDKVAAMSQEVANIFEAGIRNHPADWHMLQRVFVADLDPERLPPAAGSDASGRNTTAARTASRRFGDHPSRRRYAAASLRGSGRPRGSCPIQRIGRPPGVRISFREPGSPLGARRRV